MAYCAQADLVNEIGESLLSALCPDGAGDIDASIVTDRIKRADADINSKLGPDFNLTDVAASIADIVKYASVDLAVFYAYERRPEHRRQDGSNPEQARYDRAHKTLDEIKSGKRDMGRETSPNTSPAAAGGVVYKSTQHFITDADETTTDGPTGGF